jgi:hypothetical protein
MVHRWLNAILNLNLNMNLNLVQRIQQKEKARHLPVTRFFSACAE